MQVQNRCVVWYNLYLGGNPWKYNMFYSYIPTWLFIQESTWPYWKQWEADPGLWLMPLGKRLSPSAVKHFTTVGYLWHLLKDSGQGWNAFREVWRWKLGREISDDQSPGIWGGLKVGLPLDITVPGAIISLCRGVNFRPICVFYLQMKYTQTSSSFLLPLHQCFFKNIFSPIFK